jgi:hypothetical protein
VNNILIILWLWGCYPKSPLVLCYKMYSLANRMNPSSKNKLENTNLGVNRLCAVLNMCVLSILRILGVNLVAPNKDLNYECFQKKLIHICF